MRKILGAAAAATMLAASVMAAGAAMATQPDSFDGTNLDGTNYVEDGHKVTICHRTGSASNPYVVITVDVAAINGDEASDHDHHDQVGNGPDRRRDPAGRGLQRRRQELVRPVGSR